MKVAHFPSSFLPAIGGAEIAAHNIALQQHQAGHQVTVISSWTSWRAVASGVPYKVIPLFPKTMTVVLKARRYGYDLRWLAGKQLALYQKIHGFDVWHVHIAYPAGFVAVPMLRRMRLPSVVTCQGADIQKLPQIGYGFRMDPVVEQDITKSMLAFDRVVAISESIRSELLSIGVPSEKIRSIPNGVDASRIKLLQVNRDAIRAEMGWPVDKTILLTVGRYHPKKGYEFIPEIIKRVAAVRRDFLWVIVGRGGEPIAKMAQELGVKDYLRIVPQIGHIRMDSGHQTFSLPTEELVKIYKAADIFVFPSMLESFGIVLVEAMAAGLPIVTTDAPGCRDVIEHEITGLVSPVGDTSSMAENILRLLADPSLILELGQRGEGQSMKYEWKSVALRYCAIYEEIVPC